MSTATLEIDLRGAIARPVDEVRAQFADIEYHSKHSIHKGITFNVLKNEPNRCHFIQELAILGMKQREEAIITTNSDGSVSQEVISGFNKGLKIHFLFEPLAEQTCLVKAKFTIPLRGIKVWLKPILKIAIEKKVMGALVEDRRDLESGNYHRHYTNAKLIG